MDVHVRRAVTDGLRLRGIDVLTAQEDGATLLEDSDLLNRATNLDRMLFTQDEDLLRETKRRQQAGEPFASVVYAHQLNITIAECIDDLEIIAKATGPDDWHNQMMFLPL
jgi:predicted nuclease of predicted toxin-antitoxin system